MCRGLFKGLKCLKREIWTNLDMHVKTHVAHNSKISLSMFILGPTTCNVMSQKQTYSNTRVGNIVGIKIYYKLTHVKTIEATGLRKGGYEPRRLLIFTGAPLITLRKG